MKYPLYQYCILLLTWACIGWSGVAEAEEIETRLEPAVTPFHRPAVYTLTVYTDESSEVVFPDFEETLPGIEVTSSQPTRTVEDSGAVTWRQSYQLDPVQIQAYEIPAWTVDLGNGQSLTAPALVLQVRDLTDSERERASQFEDIVRPLDLPEARPLPAWLVLGGLALLAVLSVAACLWWYRRRNGAVVPPPSPWQVARRRLLELRTRNLPQTGRYQEYYVDLSAILRYYIEDRFHLRAPEQTTPEFLEASSTSGLLNETHEEAVSGFLRHSDRVKFARYQPSLDEMAQSFGVVQHFVEETVPEEDTAESNNDNAEGSKA